MKKSEVARLALEHIDRKNADSPILLVKHKSALNVYKERRLTVPADWLTLLDEYTAQYRTKDVIFDCTPRNLEYVLEDVGQGGGLPMKISFEMMRWTSAVRDFRAGVEADAIRGRLGLSEASWQETYSKIKKLAAQQVAIETGVPESDPDSTD
jgi:integrase/recombinase XerD